MVGTRFGWDSAPQLPNGETNDVFGEHVATAFTGATRIIHFIDVRFASLISPTYLLFLWLFPSCRVAGMTDDLSSPHRPVRLLARSQSSTFSDLVDMRLSILFSVVLSSFSLVYPLSILSSVCVHHLSSSHARTRSIFSR